MTAPASRQSCPFISVPARRRTRRRRDGTAETVSPRVVAPLPTEALTGAGSPIWSRRTGCTPPCAARTRSIRQVRESCDWRAGAPKSRVCRRYNHRRPARATAARRSARPPPIASLRCVFPLIGRLCRTEIASAITKTTPCAAARSAMTRHVPFCRPIMVKIAMCAGSMAQDARAIHHDGRRDPPHESRRGATEIRPAFTRWHRRCEAAGRQNPRHRNMRARHQNARIVRPFDGRSPRVPVRRRSCAASVPPMVVATETRSAMIFLLACRASERRQARGRAARFFWVRKDRERRSAAPYRRHAASGTGSHPVSPSVSGGAATAPGAVGSGSLGCSIARAASARAFAATVPTPPRSV